MILSSDLNYLLFESLPGREVLNGKLSISNPTVSGEKVLSAGTRGPAVSCVTTTVRLAKFGGFQNGYHLSHSLPVELIPEFDLGKARRCVSMGFPAVVRAEMRCGQIPDKSPLGLFLRPIFLTLRGKHSLLLLQPAHR